MTERKNIMYGLENKIFVGGLILGTAISVGGNLTNNDLIEYLGYGINFSNVVAYATTYLSRKLIGRGESR